MPLGLGLGISKLKSLISGLRVRFQGNATITAALDGILRELSADFVSNGTVTAALEAIKLLDVDFSGDGIVTADLTSFEGLLDLYPNAAAAYSVRLLKSDYTGALVRIRKDTAGQPEKDFYPDSNNELSLNSSDGGTTLGSWIGSNNGYIVSFYDQSGNNLDLTQSSASAQPQILSSGALITDNGKVSAQLTGNEEFIKAISWNANLYAQFSVMSNSSSGSLITLDNGSIWLRDNGSAMFAQYSGNFFNATLTTTQQAIYQGYDGSNHLYNRNNGVENLSAATTAQGTVTELSMFARRSGVNRVSGKFQEAIFYLSDQSSNISGIQTNQNDFYSIY